MRLSEIILEDASARKPDYRDRLSVEEPGLDGLPKGLRHFSIKIKGLHSYLPINYIVAGQELYTSLVEGDFMRLLYRLRVLEEDSLSALEIAILFMLLEYPNRDLRIVETMEDLALPPLNAHDIKLVEEVMAPPRKQFLNGALECTFLCANIRTSGLDRFLLRISPEYELSGENHEVMHFGGHHYSS